MRVVRTRVFERRARRLFTEAEIAEIEVLVAAAPLAGVVIPGSGGLRKLRAAASGRGKRGGARVIYVHLVAPSVIYLLTVYAKADQEDLSAEDLRQWAKFASELKRALEA
jgi:hypothetical protein